MTTNISEIFKAAYNGDSAKIKQALSDGLSINLLFERDANQSLLHYATKNNDFEFVTFLIEKKININIQDKEGETPLHMAARKGLILIVKTLVENGATIDIQNNKKSTPFNEAIYDNQIECAEFLLKNGANIDNHYDSNYEQGITSLLFAVGGGYNYSKQLVGFLIKNGANPDVKDDNGNFLLMTAIKQNTVTDELVKASLNINFKDEKGKTVVHHAASCDSIKPLKSILKHPQIDFNSLDKEGKPPLYYSVNEARAALLIKSGAAYDKTKEYDDLFWSLYREQHIDLNKLNELIASDEEEKFDTNKLCNQLSEIIENFAKEHPEETFYALTIEGNSLSLNSEESFDKTLKRYQTESPEYYSDADDIEDLKFNSGDFEYQGFAFLTKGFVYHEYDEHCNLDWNGRASSNYTIAMEALIKKLKDQKVFKPLKITKDFKVLQVEHTY